MESSHNVERIIYPALCTQRRHHIANNDHINLIVLTGGNLDQKIWTESSPLVTIVRYPHRCGSNAYGVTLKWLFSVFTCFVLFFIDFPPIDFVMLIECIGIGLSDQVNLFYTHYALVMWQGTGGVALQLPCDQKITHLVTGSWLVVTGNWLVVSVCYW